MLVYVCISENILGVCMCLGIYVCIDIHRWEGKYIIMQGDMHENILCI